MTHQNPNIPNDYNPAPEGMQAPTFTAPSHHLNNSQKEAVVELAESSHRDNNNSSEYTTGSSTGTGAGYGSGLGSGQSMRTGTGAGLGSGHTHSGEGGFSTGNGEGAMSGRDFNDTDRNIKGAHQDTSNTAPHLATESSVHQNEINAVPGVGDAAPKPGKAGAGGTGHGSFPNFANSGSDFKDQAQAQEKSGDGIYPPQRHAGKVGLGPNYSTGDSVTDKIKHALSPHSHKKHSEAVEDYERDQTAQDPMQNPVKGESGLHGARGQMNPEDSKGMASKRLGEDSTTLGERGAQ